MAQSSRHEPAAPAVLGAEYAGYDSDEALQAVYIPTQLVGPQDQEARVELREDGEGQLAMLAYSSLEDLVRGCGKAQPWISVPVSRVSHVQREAGAQIVYWDVELPEEIRYRSDEESNDG